MSSVAEGGSVAGGGAAGGVPPATRAEARRAEGRRAQGRQARGRRPLSTAARIGRVLWPIGWVLLALGSATFAYLVLVFSGR